METIRTLTLIGGISRDSLNKMYFKSIQSLHLTDFDFDVFDISKLPFFSKDLENDPPDIVTEFKERIREADAVLFITPEYNRSVPGVLKNAIDWGSRPYSHNLWDKKPAAVTGASPGNIGTFGAQHHLRQVFAYLNMQVMGQPELYFNATNNLNEKGQLSESSRPFIMKFFNAFKEHIHHTLAERYLLKQEHYHSQGLEDSPMAQWPASI